jgi:hypothetical protein
MSDSPNLERRYRRLLAFYPRAFRRDREQEILSVLMAGAGPEQRWPRLREATDLARYAGSMRLDRLQYPSSSFARNHPVALIVTRVLVGLWLVLLTLVFAHFREWWGLALLPIALLHFYLSFRLAVFNRRGPGSGGSASVLGAPGRR